MVSEVSFLQKHDDSPSDVEPRLIRRMACGDGRAWEEFHVAYDRYLCACISKVLARALGRVVREDVEEIYASIVLRLLADDAASLRSFDALRGTRFETWLGRLATNATIDHLRSLRRRPRSAPLDECEEMHCDAPSPHEVVEHKELANAVSAILGEFSAKDREFVDLYFNEGLDVVEVAERMRISVKTVYTKKNKIKERIEARLVDLRRAA